MVLNYKCKNCGWKDYLLTENEKVIVTICKKCGFVEEVEQKDNQVYKEKIINAEINNKPKCPTCQSTNIRKIGTIEGAISILGLGLLSRKINKTWKCNNCGHTW